MLIKVTQSLYDAGSSSRLQEVGVAYFDNIDKAKGYAEMILSEKDWKACRPGMVLDTYIYDLEYFPDRRLKAFGAVKIEML